MALFDRFRRTTPMSAIGIDDGQFYGAWRLSNEDYLRILGLSPAEMWRTQPYLRTVVTFLARNIAQLGLHTFERVAEDDRRRVRTGPVAAVLARPNRVTTTYELIYGLVADLALYDAAYWLLSDDPDQRIVRLPVGWVSPKGGDALGPAYYMVKMDDRGQSVRIDASLILAFHGWHPGALYAGSSPVQALTEILAEQVQAARYRKHTWERGGKVGSVLTRPPGAPKWSDEAREQFKSDWESNFTGDGPRTGGTPMFEDGMTLSRVDFSATEMQFVEGSRLALQTVASTYHVNPTMIGLLDNANYSNVVEFRKMLYGDTLGPIIAQIEDRLNGFLIPRLDPNPQLYVEFNVEAKLRGSFDEQTKALQSSIGRPWRTANEGRRLQNLPAIAGGDELVTPLNVLVGGQASPRDSAPKSAPAVGTSAGNLFLLKSRITDRQSEKIGEILSGFFDRQGKAVLSIIGAGGQWWDSQRWDGELADDLHGVALSVTATLGKNEARGLGFTAEDYDPDRTVKYLRSVAEHYAQGINETTKAQLVAAVADPESDPADVYTLAKDSRSAGGGAMVGTFLAGFATHEAAQQIAATHNVTPSKTWITGSNPRDAHAAMDGQTVSLDENFSDGSKWPGSGPDSAGCNCHVSINV